MEKRAILAAVLMAALLFVYQYYFAPPMVPPPTTPAAPGDPAQPVATAPAPAPAPTPAPPAAAVPAAPKPPQRLAPVEAPGYRGVVSSEGGKLQEWGLRYRGEKPLVALGDNGPAGLQLDTGSGSKVVSMSLEPDSLKLDAARPTGEMVLRGEEQGLRVQQTLKFQADTFAIESRVRIENPGPTPRTVGVSLPWTTKQARKDAEKFPGQHVTEVVWSTGGNIERIEYLNSVPDAVMDGEWIALGSVWYLEAMMPRSPGFKLVTSSDPKPADPKKVDETQAHTTIAVRATPTIAPGQAWEGAVLLYVGPKEYDRLHALGLDGTINFGGFPVPRRYGGLPMEWLGVPILRLLNWVYAHVGNYGIAIILLTVISKLLFYPLTVKSIRSMKAMQALAPQVNALRNKYKSDPQKLQQETLALYRQYKVNPMGGCLPMVAQVPIFYALYLALSVSVELQNAPLLCFGRIFGIDLWICDLASYDPTYVLPILMGVTMFIQQKMQPMTGDPRQAKMMLVMPFVFTFMFLNLPAGLVLYWTVSNVLQIAQQWYMDQSKTRTLREA